MDYVPSHYEVVVEKASIGDLKNTIFKSMATLEAWCSEEKAGILCDLILLTKPKNVVEIGVWGGKSLVPMGFAIRALGAGQVYGIDPWNSEASAKGMEGVNLEWWSHVNHEAIYQGLVNKIAEFGLKNQITLVRNTSAGAQPIQDIGLLHIDGNHSEEASFFDVLKWAPLVKRGGVIVFDDVNWSTTGRAVAWLDENCVKVAEVKGDNIWGIWIKP